MLDDLLAIIDKKVERLCNELLVRLHGNPSDTGALFDLYLRVLEIKKELGGSLKQDLLPTRAGEFVEDLLEVFKQVSCALEDALKKNEPLSSRITNPIYVCLYVLGEERKSIRHFSVGNKKFARLIMTTRVEIMEYLQELDQSLLRLEQSPVEDRSLREVFQYIKRLKYELNLLKLILGGESVLGSKIKHLKALFQQLYELSKTSSEHNTIVSERLIQISYACLHLLRRGMGFPGSKKEVQSIGSIMAEIIRFSKTSLAEPLLSLEVEEPDQKEISVQVKEERFRLSKELIKIEQPRDMDSDEGFARLIDLLSKLMVNRSVFNNLSRQALLKHNLPTFSQEIKASGNRFVRIMENLEDTALGLSRRYTKLVFRKQRVLPFDSDSVGQAFFIDVNQVLEVLKVPMKYLFQRKGHFFCHFRGEMIGIIFLSEFFGQATTQQTDPMAIVVITDGRVKIGVGVEKISNEQDVLVKPIPEVLVGQREIKGAAIMEDGQISLMLDAVALIQRVLDKEN